MVGIIASLMGFKEGSADPALWEGQAGMDILRGTAARRNHHQGIRDALSSMSKEEKDELVDRLLARLAFFVFDLPASERNHHRDRFGLLEHTLEVAHLTARELSGPGFEISPDVSVQHREGPRWVYAGVVAAVLHDLGKVLDLEVVAPGDPNPWDPNKEPLRLFCERKGLSETGRTFWHYLPGRGMRLHEKHLPLVAPQVLTPEVGKYLGPRLRSILDRLTSQEGWAKDSRPRDPACEVIRIMRTKDEASSVQDRDLARAEPGAPVTPAPPRPLPPPIPREAEPSPPPPTKVVGQGELWTDPAEPGPAPLPHPDREPAEPAEPPPLGPLGFWPEPVPKVSKRRGDPVESERKLATFLDPARMLGQIRRYIIRGRLDRNGLYSEVYLRPDYVWLVSPRAFRRLSLIEGLPYDQGTLARMHQSLTCSPLCEPDQHSGALVYMRPRPETRSFQAIRIKTRGFLAETELAQLGIHGYDIRIVRGSEVEESPCGIR